MKIVWRLMGIIGGGVVITLVFGGSFLMPHVESQDDGDVCSTIFSTALQAVGENCSGMAADVACYGHSFVTGELSTERDFSTSGDRIGNQVIQSLETAPVNLETGDWGMAILLMHVDEGEVPVSMVLMGDTMIRPTSGLDADSPTCDVTNAGPSNINIRRIPNTDGDILGVLAVESNAIARGKNGDGDWLFIEEGPTSGWVYTPLLNVDCDLESLPQVHTTGLVSTAPLQSILVEAAPNTSCEMLPDGLLLRSPLSAQASVVVNGVGFVFSGVGFITAQAGKNMTVRGLDGQIVITGGGMTETILAGTYTTIPLDEDLQVSGPPSPLAAIDSTMQNELAALQELIAVLNAEDIGVQACMVSSDNVAVLREGPGIAYDRSGPTLMQQAQDVIGRADGLDGYVWWRLENGNWVRDDVVNLEGDCTNVPTVETIPPTPTPGPSLDDTGAGSEGRIRRALNLNGDSCQTSEVSVGTLVTVSFGSGFDSEAEANAAMANSTTTITANGVPLEVTRRPTFCPASDCPPNGRYGYNTMSFWVPMEPGVYTVVGQDVNQASYSCVLTVYER